MRQLGLGVTALAGQYEPKHPHAKGDMKQDLAEIGLIMCWRNFAWLLFNGAEQQKDV